MTKPTVAVLGASSDRSKFGNKSVRAHLQQGYEVFPINPRGETIEGLKCYATLNDVPVKQLDRVTVYLPPKILLGVLDHIASKQPKEVWLNPGTESEEVVRKAESLGLPIIQACSIVDLGVHPGEFAEEP